MTVFRVGQRVRVKYWRMADACGCNEGVIEEVGPWISGFTHFGYIDLPADCVVHLDDGSVSAPLFDQLEPILDQHQPCESEFKESLDRMLEKVVETVR